MRPLLLVLLLASPALAAPKGPTCPTGQRVDLDLARWRKQLLAASGDTSKVKDLLAALALQPLQLRAVPADLFEKLKHQRVEAVELSSAPLVARAKLAVVQVRLKAGNLDNTRLAILRPLGGKRYCRLSLAEAKLATDESRLQVCAPRRPFQLSAKPVVSAKVHSLWMIRREPNSAVDGRCNPTSSLDVLHVRGEGLARIFTYEESDRVKVSGGYPKIFKIREFDPIKMEERIDTWQFNGKAYALAKARR